MQCAARIEQLQTLADTGWRNGPDTWGVVGTTFEALDLTVATGRMPGSTVQHGEAPPGQLYVYLTCSEALQHILSSQNEKLPFPAEDYEQHIPELVDDARGYAEDRAPQHYLLAHFDLGFTTENRVAMLELLQTVRDADLWGGSARVTARLLDESFYVEPDTPKLLRSLELPAEQIVSAATEALNRKGAIMGVSKEAFTTYDVFPGDVNITTLTAPGPSDFRLNVESGLPLEFFTELQPIGAEVKNLISR